MTSHVPEVLPAGEEPCDESYGPAHVGALLAEGVGASLFKRGYAVVALDSSIRSLYDEYAAGFAAFVERDPGHKARYALAQFQPAAHTPNQFHGYSSVALLKEQLMLRLGGPGVGEALLLTPPEVEPTYGALFTAMDGLCREVAAAAVEAAGAAGDRAAAAAMVDALLDPRELPEGYISSSILDCFSYHNHTATEEEAARFRERYNSNHDAHMDSGLVTAVVAADTPGLEVYDEHDGGKWVALEQLVHQYCAASGREHRTIAQVFLSESVSYLADERARASLRPCLHRVDAAEGRGARHSIVFKQRTAPLRTACRYQEDYEIARTHLAATPSSLIGPS